MTKLKLIMKPVKRGYPQKVASLNVPCITELLLLRCLTESYINYREVTLKYLIFIINPEQTGFFVSIY